MIQFGNKGGTTARFAACIMAALPAFGFTGCSSSKNQKSSRSEFGPTYQERMNMTDKVIKGKDLSLRSAYEKQIPKEMSEKTSAIGARNATGLKKFSGTDTAYRSKMFSQAGLQDHTEQKMAREAKEQSKMSSRLFRTPDSRFESQVSQQASKTYTPGNETFATGENRSATKELEKNKKPVILEQEKPTYSEDDVKRLLNKS